MRIKADKWVKLKEVNPHTLYWIKLESGDIVLSVYLRNEYSSGMAKVCMNNEGRLITKTNEFYMVKGAEFQEAEVGE